MTACPCIRRVWMDFNLWGFDKCGLRDGHGGAHRAESDGEQWIDVPAAEAWKVVTPWSE